MRRALLPGSMFAAALTLPMACATAPPQSADAAWQPELPTGALRWKDVQSATFTHYVATGKNGAKQPWLVPLSADELSQLRDAFADSAETTVPPGMQLHIDDRRAVLHTTKGDYELIYAEVKEGRRAPYRLTLRPSGEPEGRAEIAREWPTREGRLLEQRLDALLAQNQPKATRAKSRWR